MLGYWWYSVGAPLATAPVSPCLKIRPEIRGSHGEKLKLWFLKTINYVSRQCTEQQCPHPRAPVNVTFKCENPELNGWESGIVKFVRTLWDTLYRKPISHNQTTYNPQSVPYITPDILTSDKSGFWCYFFDNFPDVFLLYSNLTPSKYWECVEGCSESDIWACELIWS